MISAWTKDLKDLGEIERFTNSLLGSKHILRRLDELLREEEEKIDKTDRSTKAFENPNWALLHAYWNGFRSCLALVRKIINLDHKETK